MLWSRRDSVRPDRLRAAPAAGPGAEIDRREGQGLRDRRSAEQRCQDDAASGRPDTLEVAQQRLSLIHI